jgi:hypothetical protein
MSFAAAGHAQHLPSNTHTRVLEHVLNPEFLVLLKRFLK